ncbi:hydrogenase/urease maturation nickel metallochaperone HypA, partial [Enterobacter hormaechei]
MHELSLVMEVVRRVDAIAKSNNVSEVDTIVLQIGEIATVVP